MTSIQSRPPRSDRRQGGFSLTELMVAMTIGLFLLATLGYVLLGTRTTARTLDAASRLQENARFAFESMAADIRMAGFTGGPPPDGANCSNIVNNPVSWDPNLKGLCNGTPLQGYEEGGAFPTGVVPLRGDALTVVRAADDARDAFALDAGVAGNCSGATDCTLASWPATGAPQVGQVFVSADPTGFSVFQVTAVNSGARTVAHAAGGPSPGNTGGTLFALTGHPTTRMLHRLRGATYYIANNPDGAPALYRMELGEAGGDATATATEVVEGVEDIDITYGEDTNIEVPPAQPVWRVGAYRTADNVADWANVVAVRIELVLVACLEGIGLATCAAENLVSKTLTTTIAVRNRLQK